MNITGHTILKVVLVILIQLLINNYFDLGVYVCIAIFPFLVLSLPYRYSTIFAMLTGFALGLAIDILGNGILGINAAAITALAFFRKPVLQLIVNEKNVGKYDFPSIGEIGLGKYFIYTLLLYVVFFTVYVFMEEMSLSPFFFSLLRIVIGCLINVTLAIILSAIIQKRRD